ncbi:heavy metal-associated domain-containing protein [Glycomyces sp. NPDC046736]|uniref:heavy-metal-associated domain-containing protein n=1 Tax=Glycomyces sp. NPDC046736 TaxID=3155615 RepID=UPI0033EB6E45
MSLIELEYDVTGMTCGHCEGSVRAEVSAIEGVKTVDVSAKTGRLKVTAEGALSDQTVLDAVDEAGYKAVRA